MPAGLGTTGQRAESADLGAAAAPTRDTGEGEGLFCISNSFFFFFFLVYFRNLFGLPRCL